MYRVRHRRNAWRDRWPWKWLFPPVVDERFCRTCRLPYQNGPQPKEKETFTSNNVSALVYPAGHWNKDKMVVKFGRWQSRSNAFFLSDYFSQEDLKDLARVTVQAHEYVSRGKRKRSRRRG